MSGTRARGCSHHPTTRNAKARSSQLASLLLRSFHHSTDLVYLTFSTTVFLSLSPISFPLQLSVLLLLISLTRFVDQLPVLDRLLNLYSL